MTPKVRQRKIQMSLKLPPDLDNKIRDEVSDGKYTNMTDAIVEILRLHYRDRQLETIAKTINDLKEELDSLNDRCDALEKINAANKKNKKQTALRHLV